MTDIMMIVVLIVAGIVFYIAGCSYGEEEMRWGVKRPQKDKEE